MSGIINTVGSKSGIVGSDVYPAGHVIQVVENNETTGTQLFDTDIDAVVSVTITNVLASSICIIWAGATFRCQNTGTYNGGEIYI